MISPIDTPRDASQKFFRLRLAVVWHTRANTVNDQNLHFIQQTISTDLYSELKSKRPSRKQNNQGWSKTQNKDEICLIKPNQLSTKVPRAKISSSSRFQCYFELRKTLQISSKKLAIEKDKKKYPLFAIIFRFFPMKFNRIFSFSLRPIFVRLLPPYLIQIYREHTKSKPQPKFTSLHTQKHTQG